MDGNVGLVEIVGVVPVSRFVCHAQNTTTYLIVRLACTVKVNMRGCCVDPIHEIAFLENVLNRTVLRAYEADSGDYRDFKIANAGIAVQETTLYEPCTSICKRAISDGCSCSKRIGYGRCNTAGGFGPSVRLSPS
jgi:hypothetical protein